MSEDKNDEESKPLEEVNENKVEEQLLIKPEDEV
jgi:hypothetical protein